MDAQQPSFDCRIREVEGLHTVRFRFSNLQVRSFPLKSNQIHNNTTVHMVRRGGLGHQCHKGCAETGLQTNARTASVALMIAHCSPFGPHFSRFWQGSIFWLTPVRGLWVLLLFCQNCMKNGTALPQCRMEGLRDSGMIPLLPHTPQYPSRSPRALCAE